MIALRLLSLIAAGLVLVVPPLLMFDGAGGYMSGWAATGVLLLLVLMSASFIFVGMAGKRMRRPGPARLVGGALLMVPACAALAMLATRTGPDELWGSGILLMLTMLLFVSFVYPATAGRRQRPMRQRERHDNVVFLHQRN